MTKADLIDEVSRAAGIARKESEAIIEVVVGSIVNCLRNGEKLEIRGLGSFRTRQRPARVGRNPKTGAEVQIPPKQIPYFKPGKELRDLVNNSAGVQIPAIASAPPDQPAQ